MIDRLAADLAALMSAPAISKVVSNRTLPGMGRMSGMPVPAGVLAFCRADYLQ